MSEVTMRAARVCAVYAVVLCGLATFSTFAQSTDELAAVIRNRNASLAARKAAVSALLEKDGASNTFVSAAAAALADPASSDEWRLFLVRVLSVSESASHDDYTVVATLFLDGSEPEELRFAAAQRLVRASHVVDSFDNQPSSAALLEGAASVVGDRRFSPWFRQVALDVFSAAAEEERTRPEELMAYVRSDAPVALLTAAIGALSGTTIDDETRISDSHAATILQIAFGDAGTFRRFDRSALQTLAKRASCRPLLISVARDASRAENERLFAFDALSDAVSDPQVVAMASALTSDQGVPPHVRTAALVLLSQTKMAPPNVVNRIYEILKRADPSDFRRAIEALGKISSNKDSSVRTLVNFVRTRRGTSVCSPQQRGANDQDEETEENPCVAAIASIGSLKAAPDDAVPLLRDLLTDETYWSAAARALSKYGKEAVIQAKPELVKQLQRHNASSSTVSALRVMGWKAVDTLPTLVTILTRKWTSRANSIISAIDFILNDAIASTGEMSAGEIGGAIAQLDETISKLRGATVMNTQTETLIGKLNAASKALRDAKQLKFVTLIQSSRWVKIVGAILLWILIVLTICAVLVRLRPLWVLAVHNFVKRYATIKVFGIEFPIGDVLLVSFFAHRDRVLDAWVAKHIDVAGERFRAKETVKTRLHNVPLPVELEDERYDDGLPHYAMTRLFARRTCLLVRAQGGAGKTSLAVQIALNAISDDTPTRFMPQRALPVMIEEELPAPEKDGKSRLIEVIAGRLADLVGGGEPISSELLDRLLRRGRVLVIIDHLSEMGERTRDQVNPAAADFPIRSLVITSRVKESLGGAVVATLRPLRIQWSSVARFLQLYLTMEKKLANISQGDFHRHCGRLVELAGDGEVTVLMAKLFAELVATAGPIPTTIPDLVLEYLNHLNSTRTAADPDNLELQRVATAAAYACLVKSFSPKPALRADVIARIAAPNAEQLVAYLERLGVVQTSGAGRLVKFTLDPVAEYLAALRLVEMNGGDEAAWTKLLAEPRLSDDNTDLVRGFLHALVESIRAREEMNVPQSVLDAIEPRLRALRLVA